tara:strand:- start:2692 stop:3525 length:834 start_codon:yes stop_codon:yes gene_type:complete
LISEIISNQFTLFVLLILPIAAIAGFFAGLFGIGGGLITVPFLYFVFETLNIDSNYIMHLSVGTSFSIIVFTATASVLTHLKYKSVDLEIIKNYGIFVIIGVSFGAILAAFMKTKSLLLFFSIIVYILGAYLLNLHEKTKEIKPNFTLLPKIILGFLSGFISGPMGIGGAIINVPVLRYFGYPINKAIGSAATIGLIIAIFGALGFLITGIILKANLPLSVGFINIPAFLIFIPITTFMARIGAKTTHKLEKYKLQRMFGIFLYIIGTVFLYRYLIL